MIRLTKRTARKAHRCTRACGTPIRPGDRYVEAVASPHHDDLNNPTWWRLAECWPCAVAYGQALELAVPALAAGPAEEERTDG